MTTFLRKSCRPMCLPYVSITLFTAIVSLFYLTDYETAEFYAYHPAKPWYTALAYAFFHADSSHLWSNASVLLLYGGVFELTEEPARAVAVVLASIPASAGGHAIFSHLPVVGASGFVYAIICYQLAILVKNWREMGVEYETASSARFLVSCVASRGVYLGWAFFLLAVEIVGSLYTSRVSHWGHAFGAAAGVTAGLVLASNLKYDVGEVVLVVLGCAGYAGLVASIFASRQLGAASAMLPIVVLFVACTAREVHGRCVPVSVHMSHPASHAV